MLSSPLLTKDGVGSLHKLQTFSVQSQGELELGANPGAFWKRVRISFSVLFIFFFKEKLPSQNVCGFRRETAGGLVIEYVK